MSNEMMTRISSEESMQACTTVQSLVNCKEFYVVLEKFCNVIAEEKPVYAEFLNLYFHDDGYVDIWRIPHLMIDAVQQNLKLHKLFEEETFRIMFHRFLAELYNYCLLQYRSGFLENLSEVEVQEVVHELRAGQSYMNSLMDIFVEVMESIENKEKLERIA